MNKPKSDEETGHSGPDQERGKYEERKIRGDIHVHGKIETNLPASATEEHKTEREEDRTRDRKNFWIGVATLVAVIVYAGLTFWQGLMTRESIDNTSRHFQIDQRPYLWKLEYLPPKNIHIVANERMWLNIHWVNYGKSPAVRTKGDGKIFVGPTARQEADRWFANLGDGPLTTQPEEGMIVLPGIPSNQENPVGGYSTIRTDNALKPEELDHILHTDNSMVMVFRLQYYDMHGNRYWSDFCFSRFAAGSFPYCDRHNEMH